MSEMLYEDYLKSNSWGLIRDLALKRALYRCQGCGDYGSERVLEVHHRTYENAGHEMVEDLTVFCHRCHRVIHLAAGDSLKHPKYIQDVKPGALVAAAEELWQRLGKSGALSIEEEDKTMPQ